MKLNHKPEGLALLSHSQVRRKLKRDMQQWLNNGNQVTRLPEGRAAGIGHYERLNDIMVETGLRCEY